MVRFIMDCRRKRQARQHLPAPCQVLILAQMFQDAGSGAALETLHNPAGSIRRLRPQKQMEVLRHKHPADQQKAGGFSDIRQRVYKAAAATLRPKQRRPPVNAGGDELQFARNVGKPAACHVPAVYASRLSQDQSLRHYADTTKQASAPAPNIANTQTPSVSVARGACDKIALFSTTQGGWLYG